MPTFGVDVVQTELPSLWIVADGRLNDAGLSTLWTAQGQTHSAHLSVHPVRQHLLLRVRTVRQTRGVEIEWLTNGGGGFLSDHRGEGIDSRFHARVVGRRLSKKLPDNGSESGLIRFNLRVVCHGLRASGLSGLGLGPFQP